MQRRCALAQNKAGAHIDPLLSISVRFSGLASRYQKGFCMASQTLEQEVLSFLLPHKTTILHDEKRTLIAIHSEDESTVIKNFSLNEWKVFLCLLRSFPFYASHEQLLASVTNLKVEESRSRLLAARSLDETGGCTNKRRWLQEFRPVIRALSTLRKKLTAFSLTITPARNMGYSITASSQEPQTETATEDIPSNLSLLQAVIQNQSFFSFS